MGEKAKKTFAKGLNDFMRGNPIISESDINTNLHN